MDLGSWTLDEEFVSDYLNAVCGTLPAYARHNIVPPVALSARALGSFLGQSELPPGAIHSLQEITAFMPVFFGQKITATADVSQPKRRGRLGFITADIKLTNKEGGEVLHSKSTVLIVGPESPAAATPESEKGPSRPKTRISTVAETGLYQANAVTSTKDLPTVAKTITQDQLNSYARVSGDSNPLHLDPEFAATTQFGGIIAHGMLTLAFVSEMMAARFEKNWLESGTLRVRFKGAAYVGDSLETWGRVDKEEPVLQGRRTSCTVGVRNLENGQELVSGTATVLR